MKFVKKKMESTGTKRKEMKRKNSFCRHCDIDVAAQPRHSMSSLLVIRPLHASVCQKIEKINVPTVLHLCYFCMCFYFCSYSFPLMLLMLLTVVEIHRVEIGRQNSPFFRCCCYVLILRRMIQIRNMYYDRKTMNEKHLAQFAKRGAVNLMCLFD